MAYPSDGLLFKHKREEEALNILIWNKLQGTPLTKQSKLKMASRVCHHKWKTTPCADTSMSVCAPGRYTGTGNSRRFEGKVGGWEARSGSRLAGAVLCTLNLLHLQYVLRLPIQK